MMFGFSETFTLLIETVTGRDLDGNDVRTDVASTITGGFAPAGSTELVQGQLTVITHDTLYLDAGQPTPGPQDRVIARGRTYRVDGTSGDYRSPLTGWHPGAVVRLVEVTG